MIAIIVHPSMHYCPQKLLQHATYLHIYMYVYAHMYMLIKWVHLCKNGVASSNSPYQSMCADTCVCLDNAIKKYIRNVCIQTRRLQLQISIRRLTLPGLPGWIEFDSISTNHSLQGDQCFVNVLRRPWDCLKGKWRYNDMLFRSLRLWILLSFRWHNGIRDPWKSFVVH